MFFVASYWAKPVTCTAPLRTGDSPGYAWYTTRCPFWPESNGPSASVDTSW